MKALALRTSQLITLLLLLPTLLNAQTILNGDFGAWIDPGLENVEPRPENWTTNEGIGPSLGFVTRCVGYQGFGAQVKAINRQGTVYSGILSYGKAVRTGYNLNSTHAGHPFSQRPISFTGAYSFFPDFSDGDAAEVTVVLKKYNSQTQIADTIASGVMSFSASKDMKGFELPLNYRSSDTPDTLTIVFVQSKTGSGELDTASYFRVDQLGFDQHVGLLDSRKQPNLNLYPNPSNTCIHLEWKGASSESYKIFDSLGKLVASGTIIKGDLVDISQLKNGVYTIAIGESSERAFVQCSFIKSDIEK